MEQAGRQTNFHLLGRSEMDKKVALISLFRNNSGDVGRIISEYRQHGFTPDRLIRICVEGDSEDDTFAALESASKSIPLVLRKFDQGNPHYKSEINRHRLECLTRCWNIGLELFLESDAEFGMIIDSDIAMPDNIIPILLQECRGIIAPLMLFEASMFFRDTWGYRDLNDNDFYNHPPFTGNFDWLKPFEVSSVGLPFFHRNIIESGLRFSDDEVVGFCRAARRQGHRIFATPNARVYHPRVVEVPKVYDREWFVPSHISHPGQGVRIRAQKRRRP